MIPKITLRLWAYIFLHPICVKEYRSQWQWLGLRLKRMEGYKLQISQLFEVNKQIMYLKGGGCLSTKGPLGPEVDKFPDHPEGT